MSRGFCFLFYWKMEKMILRSVYTGIFVIDDETKWHSTKNLHVYVIKVVETYICFVHGDDYETYTSFVVDSIQCAVVTRRSVSVMSKWRLSCFYDIFRKPLSAKVPGTSCYWIEDMYFRYWITRKFEHF